MDTPVESVNEREEKITPPENDKMSEIISRDEDFHEDEEWEEEENDKVEDFEVSPVKLFQASNVDSEFLRDTINFDN